MICLPILIHWWNKLLTFSIVAPDLYEEIPKQTCFPERNHKYDMKVQAKLDCGKDEKCAAVVEAPKRRNQNKKSPYGNFSLTEKEYILCNYPLGLKATDDTLLFKKRGNWIISRKMQPKILKINF